MQTFMAGVRTFQLKRNIDLIYAEEQYVDEPSIVETLTVTVQQYQRTRGCDGTEHYLVSRNKKLHQYFCKTRYRSLQRP